MPKRIGESLSSGADIPPQKRPQTERIPLSQPNADSEATKIPPAGLAFRISRIPNSITRDQFLQILHSFHYNTLSGETVGGQQNVLGWSYAPSAPTAESNSYKTATVTFASVPINFQFGGAPITLTIGPIPNQFSIVIDKHFYGLTTLYSSEQPLVEYV